MLLKIVIIVILIVINILAFIYMYKNDSDEINYDKWCKMLQDETKDNIELISIIIFLECDHLWK